MLIDQLLFRKVLLYTSMLCKSAWVILLPTLCIISLQPIWASLIAQLVKNPPAMQEITVQFLGQEDPLQKG